MILGGLEILLGKAIIGKIFAGAATKAAIGVAAKAMVVHDIVQAVGSASDALDAATKASIAIGADEGPDDLGGSGGGGGRRPTSGWPTSG